ncbi:Regulatory protein YeiL [Paenibacillus auburnensis]|jgi:CRP/FNR family transcriptional regulator, putaive post-exponential-phase nitrogen-starvation regulator|uniref:Regulatory protein YeiL n=1 Tax=Paenibacillus auburnensis TaxID=2905649 RepID=A0ABM9BMF1_9BACL|nr:cyclic nucleotide-binding domain-containing protein [Paenibacillus auburnensis]CAH1190506.1 Regulatory protein YeiL [Paenibacillus auburnensis]
MQSIIDPEVVHRLAEQNGLGEMFSSGVIAAMELRRYSDGEAVCSVGDRLESMFILVQGKLKIHTLLPNGKSMLVRFARPMSVIGDVELLRQYPVKNEVESVGDSLLLVAGRKMLLKELEENTVLLRFLMGELSHKMYTLGQTSALNLLYPVENRFASYLMSLFEDNVGGQRVEEIRTSSLTETADLLGTSYRHLNRIVRRFIEEGIIERKRGRLSVLDKTRLAQLANGNLYE